MPIRKHIPRLRQTAATPVSFETRCLARFAAGVNFHDIPVEALDAAKSVVIDAVAVGLFGSRLPWSRIVASTALGAPPGGDAPILDDVFTRTRARTAALINGTFIHAFEFDSLRYPNAGVHAGSTIWPAVFAVGSARSTTGETALAALVAGCEVAFRIGLAGKAGFEHAGFHAPGITGVFGAAAAAGRIMNLDETRMANAFGIAGSMCAGLLAFSRSGTGGAVKPLHMGRAAEAGVFAAELAGAGLEGSQAILEGKFGVLDAYARHGDPAQLCEALGERWETQTVCVKKYPCHVTAQTVVEGIRDIVTANGIDVSSIAHLELGVNEKVLSHHAGREPRDVSTSQYSVPMCAAIALHRDPKDPDAFLSNPHNDPSLLDWAGKVALTPFTETSKPGFEWASKIVLTLREGKTFSVVKKTFEGMDPRQVNRLALRKFDLLTSHLARSTREPILSKLTSMEKLKDLSLLAPPTAPAGRA